MQEEQEDALIPTAFTDAITMEMIVDPVITADGHTYSRAAIARWLATHDTSPATGSPLEHTRLVPNHALRKAIAEWRERRPMALVPARLSLTPTLLGEGSFGRVVAGRLNTGVGRPPAPVAVKTITGVGDARRRFDEELRAHMHAAQHCDGVCVLHGTCEKNGQLCIVMKCYERSLDAALAEAPGHALDAPTAQRYAHSLFRTLRQLHECPRPLIVQDIKPQNILIDAHGEVVLADFGVAQVVRTQTRVRPSSVRGTFNYMSPEAFDPEAHGGTGPPADVWSLACVLVEMLSGRAPWAGMPMQQIITAVVVRRRVPDVPEDAPAAELLRRCFSFDAAARPTAADRRRHRNRRWRLP